MPLFASLFLSLFTSLAGFFATWVTKKTALAIAAVSTFAIITGVMTLAIGTAITAVMALPVLPNAVSLGIRIFLPPNVPLIAATLLAADAAITIYKWNIENIKLASYVT